METPLPIHPNDAEAQDLLASETYGDVNAALHELNNDDKEALIDQKLPPASYWNLLRTHGEYRLFMASYVVTHCGEYVCVARDLWLDNNCRCSDLNIHY